MELTDPERCALERLADKLEVDLMPCPLGRPALLMFLQGQVEALRRTPPPSAADATWLIDNAYIQWVAAVLEE